MEAHATCDELRSLFAQDTVAGSDALNRLDSLVKQDDLCAKNLLGKLYFEGKHISRDIERAHAIFYDLAERNYPPAKFNLAFKLSLDALIEPTVVLALVQELFASHQGSDEYGRLANNARDLGRSYIANLVSKAEGSDAPRIRALSDGYEDFIRLSTQESAAKAIERTREVHSTSDSIAAVVSLGLAVSSVASVAARARPRPSSCTYLRCDPFLSTGDLYNLGILK
ncbi:MAG: sel1 repeat family protein [Acidobacteria bacterium]|nr:sel1 repeat family protein [Acidobacteriota bacterium]